VNTSLESAIGSLFDEDALDGIFISKHVKETEVSPNYKNLTLNRCMLFLTESADCDWAYSANTVYIVGKSENTFPVGAEHAIKEVRRLSESIKTLKRTPIK
jgi:hypothetical protein